jgi:bacterioferritin-associated ferredoxin
MYICICNAVTDTALKKCIEDNSCTTVSQVKKICHAGNQCGTCIPWIKKMLKEKNQQEK